MSDYKIGKPIVTLKDVSKSFGNKLILRDVGTEKIPFVIYDINRADLSQGQTIAIVGESGSGKSTLFKLLAGIYPATKGSIEILDWEDNSKYQTVRGGDVGFVQQTYPLSRNQNVYEMLTDAAIQGNVPKNDRKSIIESYLEKWNLINQKFLAKNQLSGGQKQRVAIIEQLLCSHYLVIFDEPFSGLDVRNIEDVKNSFRKISSTSEINTIVFSAHDINLAVELADVVYVIGYERGRDGLILPGGTIVKKFDLMEMGLAWKELTAGHLEVASEIKNIIKT
ncbi:MAG TPA: ATP-binding cassette domain-containing protein [Candidatus Paceibacterota bacterium]|nr:ATP-binding cassette domain-containing protein [Candidatus Paceibacterota bacterium]